MKKKYWIFLFMSIVILFSNGKKENNEYSASKIMKEKNAVDDVQLKKVNLSKKKIIYSEKLSLNNTEECCLDEKPIMKKYILDSDLIVMGEVVAVEFYDVDGIPWSKLDVEIKEVLSGEGKVGKKIQIFVMEGYIYNDLECKTVIECVGDDIGMHHVGDKSIYILSEENGDDIFSKGSYRRTFSVFSEYRYVKSEGKYNMYDVDGKILYQKNELLKKLNIEKIKNHH